MKAEIGGGAHPDLNSRIPRRTRARVTTALGGEEHPRRCRSSGALVRTPGEVAGIRVSIGPRRASHALRAAGRAAVPSAGSVGGKFAGIVHLGGTRRDGVEPANLESGPRSGYAGRLAAEVRGGRFAHLRRPFGS